MGGEAYVAASSGSPVGFVSLTDAIARIEESPAGIRGVRLEWDDFSITWDNPGASDHAGMGILAPDFDWALCRSVVELTASPAVVEHLDMVLQRVRPVVDASNASGQGVTRGGGSGSLSSPPPSVSYVGPQQAPFRRSLDRPATPAL